MLGAARAYSITQHLTELSAIESVDTAFLHLMQTFGDLRRRVTAGEEGKASVSIGADGAMVVRGNVTLKVSPSTA